MRRFTVVLTSLVMLTALLFSSCAAAPEPVNIEKPVSAASQIICDEPDGSVKSVDFSIEKEGVTDYLNNISSVLRVSGQEKQIQDYLLDWAADNNLSAEIDTAGNIIVDRPASEGYENKPAVILQAHMDTMYYGADVSSGLVPALTVDGDFVIGSGTACGIDDGIGMAVIMQILTSESCAFGPVRAIFTCGGDFTMAGASALDASYLNADYLISYDGKKSDSICYGHTGSRLYSFSRTAEYEINEKDLCAEILLTGLTGGDSGLYVDEGRANAIRCAGECLEHLSSGGVDVSVAGVSYSGTFMSIPVAASIRFCFSSENADLAGSLFEEYKSSFETIYGANETGFELSFNYSDEIPDKVLTQDVSNGFLNFLTLSIEGVNTMSSQAAGVVESSCSLCGMDITEDSVQISRYVRGYSLERLVQIANSDSTLASMCGFDMALDAEYPGWTATADEKLLNMAADLYGEILGTKTGIDMLNTSLECGILSEKKDTLQMIVLGTDISNNHSFSESADISRLENVLYLSYAILEGIN